MNAIRESEGNEVVRKTSAVLLGLFAMTATAAIRIDGGRQLFVDDELVAGTNGVVRHWNRPTKVEDPVVWPEKGPENLTGATDGGLWWDPKIRRFRLWYQKNWCGQACYAESADGDTWEYPDLGIVPGSNRIFAREPLDSWCVVPDYTAADPYSRWCMHISAPGGDTNDMIFDSRDGRRFTKIRVAGRSGDRSTMYFDPFRGKWVFSLRDFRKDVGRCRRYFAADRFDASCSWTTSEEWLVATNRPNWQLYSFDAVAYESLMLGVMEVLYKMPGDNQACKKVGLPRQTGLHFCFSRDGRTFVPRDEADIAPEGWGSGKWDSGYLSAIGGICVIRDERLWFYYTALRGDGCRLEQKDGKRNGMYANGSIGAATLRRDGFAGMVSDARGEIMTRPLVFSGTHLFVNAECRFGSVAAEVLGADGKVVPGFSLDDCTAFARADSTKTELRWKDASLSDLKNREVRFRFVLRCATLYSFWVSESKHGESGGYLAGGGPAYRGLRDL